jgi:hypothetical protein
MPMDLDRHPNDPRGHCLVVDQTTSVSVFFVSSW